MLHDMFALTLPVAEKMLRPLIVYAALVFLLRIFGKRELAQMNPFDLVVLLMLSNTVQNAIIGEDNSVTGGLLGAASLLTVNYLVVRFVFRHRRLDQIVAGGPTVLVQDGKIIKSNMAKELISIPELRMVAHRQGFHRIEDIEQCVLEPGGVFYFETKPKGPSDAERILARLEEMEARLSAILGQ
jgi:uncharacterized membrane protein YcaP (DUF421 family)